MIGIEELYFSKTEWEKAASRGRKVGMQQMQQKNAQVVNSVGDNVLKGKATALCFLGLGCEQVLYKVIENTLQQ